MLGFSSFLEMDRSWIFGPRAGNATHEQICAGGGDGDHAARASKHNYVRFCCLALLLFNCEPLPSLSAKYLDLAACLSVCLSVARSSLYFSSSLKSLVERTAAVVWHGACVNRAATSVRPSERFN